MTILRTLISCMLIVAFMPIYAQLTFDVIDLKIEKTASASPLKVDADFAPLLTHIEARFPGGDKLKQRLIAQKKRQKIKNSRAENSSSKTNAAAKPIMGRNFEGNLFASGVPNDNDLAISNGGMLVSVINSNIYMYDVNQDSLLMTISLSAFSESLNLPHGDFDPHVVYDPDEDKFVLVFLNGRVDTTSKIVVAFSATNDPTADWNFYALDGDPLNQVAWSDYPLIGLSDEEFFITMNLIYNDSSWQEGFVETIVWQVDKFDGFAGNQVDTRLYSDVRLNGKPLRNLCPVEGGSSPSGPGMYFLSNRNFDIENDSIFLVHINGNQSAPSTTLSLEVLSADLKYGLPPDGEQGFNHFLATNDARILSAIIEDGIIQFVGNTIDFNSGRAAVYHGLVHDLTSSPYVEGAIISDPNVDLGYPVISYTGRFAGDRQSIISYNYTAVDTPPGIAATFYHQFEGYSERKVIKTGDSYVNVLSGTLERWGDYSGSQIKYDEPGTVWIAGFYGHRRQQSPPPTRINATWIAELQSPFSPVAGIDRPTANLPGQVYPNPSEGRYMVEFSAPDYEMAKIELLNSEGQRIALLYSGLVKKGENRFSFNQAELQAGTYFLHVSSRTGCLVERVILLK